MRKILTIFSDENTQYLIYKYKFKEIIADVKSISISSFENLCEVNSKKGVEVIFLEIAESQLEDYELLKDFSRIAKKYKLIFVLIVKDCYKDIKKFLELGFFDLVTNQRELEFMLIRLKNTLELLGKTEEYNINFTATELRIFQLLKENQNKIVEYTRIKEVLTGEKSEYVFDDEMNSMKSLIYKIKKKLEKINYKITNVKTRGYILSS